MCMHVSLVLALKACVVRVPSFVLVMHLYTHLLHQHVPLFMCTAISALTKSCTFSCLLFVSCCNAPCLPGLHRWLCIRELHAQSSSLFHWQFALLLSFPSPPPPILVYNSPQTPVTAVWKVFVMVALGTFQRGASPRILFTKTESAKTLDDNSNDPKGLDCSVEECCRKVLVRFQRCVIVAFCGLRGRLQPSPSHLKTNSNLASSGFFSIIRFAFCDIRRLFKYLISLIMTSMTFCMFFLERVDSQWLLATEALPCKVALNHFAGHLANRTYEALFEVWRLVYKWQFEVTQTHWTMGCAGRLARNGFASRAGPSKYSGAEA